MKRQAKATDAGPNQDAINSVRVPDGIKTSHIQYERKDLSPSRKESIAKTDSSFFSKIEKATPQQSPTADSSASLTDGDIPAPTSGM